MTLKNSQLHGFNAGATGGGGPGALVRKAVDQTSVNYNLETLVTWDTEVYDKQNWHSASNSYFKITKGPRYVRLGAQITAANVTANASSVVRFGKGGTPWNNYPGEAAVKYFTGFTTPHVNLSSPVLPVRWGDRFDFLYQQSDVSMDITSAQSWFSLENINPATFSGALVTLSSAITGVNYTTATAIAYTTEQYDVGGWFDAGSPTRLTVPSGVDYVRITFCQEIGSFVGGEWIRGSVKKNGSTTAFMPGSLVESSGTMYTTANSPVLPVTAGDYFEHLVQIEADTSVDINTARTSFHIEAVSATGFSGALVTKAADANGNYTVAALITWDDEAGGGYDVGGWHSTVSNTSRLTVPNGVTKVRLRAQIDLSNLSVGGVANQVRMLKNGSASWNGFAGRSMRSTSAFLTHNICTPIIDVVAGDYFEIEMLQSTDNAITVLADTSWFFIEAISG